MPAIKTDYQQVTLEEVSTQDTEDQTVDGEGYFIPVFIPTSDVSSWLSAYDPSNEYSPNATDSRIIARIVLDALKKKAEE
jgi:hypothetical protein